MLKRVRDRSYRPPGVPNGTPGMHVRSTLGQACIFSLLAPSFVFAEPEALSSITDFCLTPFGLPYPNSCVVYLPAESTSLRYLAIFGPCATYVLYQH